MKNELLDKVLRMVTTEYLNGVLLEVEEDVTKLSAGKINSYKKEAERILKMDVFRYVVRQIADQTKDTILLKSLTQDDVLVNRGILLGLKHLEGQLLQWCARSGNAGSEEEA